MRCPPWRDHRIPLRHKRVFIMLLQAASTGPLPIKADYRSDSMAINVSGGEDFHETVVRLREFLHQSKAQARSVRLARSCDAFDFTDSKSKFGYGEQKNTWFWMDLLSRNAGFANFLHFCEKIFEKTKKVE